MECKIQPLYFGWKMCDTQDKSVIIFNRIAVLLLACTVILVNVILGTVYCFKFGQLAEKMKMKCVETRLYLFLLLHFLIFAFLVNRVSAACGAGLIPECYDFNLVNFNVTFPDPITSYSGLVYVIIFFIIFFLYWIC